MDFFTPQLLNESFFFENPIRPREKPSTVTLLRMRKIRVLIWVRNKGFIWGYNYRSVELAKRTMGAALRNNGLPLPVEESGLEGKSSEMVPGREFGVSSYACASQSLQPAAKIIRITCFNPSVFSHVFP